MNSSDVVVAANLWYQRDVALDDPALTLADLDVVDGALHKTLATIRHVPRLDSPGAVFVGTVVHFDETVLKAAEETPEQFRGLESALGWMSFSDVPLSRLPLRAVIAACAVHRQPLGDALLQGLASADDLLRARSLKALWQLGRIDLVQRIVPAYDDSDLKCRFSACWAGALLAGDPRAIAGLKDFAETGARYPDRAVQLVCARLSPEEARSWLKTLPPWLAFLGAASVGRTKDVLWLLDSGATEAVYSITGLSPEASVGWRGADARHLLGHPVSTKWMLTVLRDARMPFRHIAAMEYALLKDGPGFEFRAPAFRQRDVLSKII